MTAVAAAVVGTAVVADILSFAWPALIAPSAAAWMRETVKGLDDRAERPMNTDFAGDLGRNRRVGPGCTGLDGYLAVGGLSRYGPREGNQPCVLARSKGYIVSPITSAFYPGGLY